MPDPSRSCKKINVTNGAAKILHHCLVLLNFCVLVLNFCVLAGCSVFKQDDQDKQAISRIPSPQQILSGNHFEIGMGQGKLLDRAAYVAQLPSRLFRLANLMEQESAPVNTISQARVPQPFPAITHAPYIAKLLESNQPTDRSLGLELHKEIPALTSSFSLDHWIQAISDQDPYVRMATVHMLAQNDPIRLSDPAIISRLLKDPHEFVRLETVRALAHGDQTEQVFAWLYQATDDSSVWVRGEIARWLGARPEPTARQALLKLAEDSDLYVQEQARQALQTSP